MLKDLVEQHIETFLKEREDIFIINFTISTQNEIDITIDGDNGVRVKDCLQLSRQIENNIDRDEVVDYALKVSSCGATSPLVNIRQYYKNKGRKIEVTTDNKTYTGKMIEVEDQAVTLQWKERVPKDIGKGKMTKEFTETIPVTDIKNAKIIITF